MSTFGEWLQEQRNQRRLTRVEFAQRVGCSVAMLRKIETDERRPSAQIAGLIANALGLPPAEQVTFVRVARGELGIDRLRSAPSPVRGSEMPRPQAGPRNNLPILPTPLIGRQHELGDLQSLIRDPHCRMLTLVGPGGIGKTRLAIEAATQMQEEFADGVYFVPLAPVDSSKFIVPVIAHSIGFGFSGAGEADPKTQLFNFLQDKRMLLLLDNMEHLLKEPGTDLIAELLACAPNITAVVTSRESMNLQVEWVYDVQGLPVPIDSDSVEAAQGTSIELFLQRARRAYVGFNPGRDEYPAIVRICRLLDGMPLAIELAAAWVRTLTCAEIGDEIERSLGFLTVTARDMPPRHRSMRAVFDHSWQLLSDGERGVLARLSVFRGGFGREAAERVAGASLGMLSALVAKSLLRRPEAGRYDLHELIRQFAALHLEEDPAEAEAARNEHYAFYLAFAQATAPQLKSSRQLECLRILEQEHDNFRAALDWSLEGDRSEQGTPNVQAMHLAGALRWFWKMRGYFDEGSSWLMKALKQGPEGLSPDLLLPAGTQPADRQALARALVALASLNNSVGNHAVAHALAEQSAAVFRELGDKPGLADAILILGEVARWEGDATLSSVRLQEALALNREVGDRWGTAEALFRLGLYLSDFASDAAGQAMLEESSTILEELGDAFLAVGVVAARGVVAVNTSHYAAALSHFEQALAKARELRDPWGMADALTNIGCVRRIQGDYIAALPPLEDALKLYQQSGIGIWCADAFCALAENEIAQGNLAAARVYLQGAMTSSTKSGNRWLQILVGYFEGLLAYYERAYSHAIATLEKTTALAREGQYVPDLARSLVSLGRALHANGEAEPAQAALTEGLRVFWGSGNRLGVASALEAFAELSEAGDAGRTAQLFGAAEAIRTAIGAPLPPIDRPVHEIKIAAARAELGDNLFEAATARGRSEPLEAIVAEILASSNKGQ